MKQKKYLLLIITALIPFLVFSQPGKVLTIAVIDLDISSGVPVSYQRPLSDRLRQELINTGRFTVVERNNMESVLEEQGLQLSGCTSDECAVEMGRLLGVDRMIAGSLAKVGQTHTINLRMINVEVGRIEMARSVDCQCTIDEVLTSKMREIANLMAGIEIRMPSRERLKYGSLLIKSALKKGIVLINGVQNESGFPAVFNDMVAGKYKIEVTAPDYESYTDSVEIMPDKKVTITANLKRHQGLLGVSGLPDGTAVFVDGKKYAKTPCDDKMIDIGTHSVQLRHNEYISGSVKDVEIRHNERIGFEFDLLRKPEYKSLLGYAIWPGLGQFRDKRKLIGASYATGQAATLGFLAYTILELNSSISDYQAAKDEYDLAIAESDVSRTYAAKMDADAKIDDSETMVVIAAGITAGVYLWNMVDAMIFRSEISPDESSTGETSNKGDIRNDKTTFTMKLLNDSGNQPVPGISIGIRFDLNGRNGQ